MVKDLERNCRLRLTLKRDIFSPRLKHLAKICVFLLFVAIQFIHGYSPSWKIRTGSGQIPENPYVFRKRDRVTVSGPVSSYFPTLPESGSDVRIRLSCPGWFPTTAPVIVHGQQDMSHILSCLGRFLTKDPLAVHGQQCTGHISWLGM